jgi:TolB protein
LVVGRWSLIVGLLLAGCSRSEAQPTPDSALVPLKPRPTTAGPAPTVAAEGAGLPGRLLFVQGGDIWLWQGETGSQLTRTGDAYQPAWAPDGQRIAYVRRVQSYSDVMVMLPAGGEPVRLTEDGPDESVYSYERVYASMWAFYPAWSPDGATIAYASQGGPPFGEPAAEFHMSLFSVPAAGGERAQLYAEAGVHVGRLAFAPGGDIVFARQPASEGAPSLYRFSGADESATPLAGAPEQSYDPAFSPDGRWLAFAARAEGGTDIFALPAANTSASGGTASAPAPIRLTNLGTARAPAFSPDGTLLAFLAIAPETNSFDLYVADIAPGPGGAIQAGEPRRITQEMRLDADSGLSWSR